MALSIRGRLTLWYGLVLLAVLFASGAALQVVHYTVRLADFDQQLANRSATVVAELVQELADGETLDETVQEVDELALPGTGVAVVDDRGRVLAYRGIGTLDVPRSDVARYHDAATVSLATGQARVRPDVLEWEGTRLRVVVWTSLAGFRRERAVLSRALLLGVPLVVLVAIAGGWSISRRALRPLTEMAGQAGAITNRTLDTRLTPPQTEDELGTLTKAFNGLLDRLAGALQLQRRFMADASHELRTPVSVVRTTAQVTLDRETRSEGEYRESLEVIAQQAGRLTKMVNDMFTLALADANGRPLQHQQLYFDELLEECVRAAHAIGDPRRVDVRVAAPPHELPFAGDEELLRQMLLNLLENAVHHSEPAQANGSRGQVDLNVTHHGREILVTIDDTGPGIPEADRERIFERFVRVDRTSSNTGGGLGLAIARWVAEIHGGSIIAESSPSGGGRFVVRLPRPAPM